MFGNTLVESPAYHLLLGGLCGVLGFRLGWNSRHRLLMPVIQGALAFAGFAAIWRIAGAIAAATTVGGWAVATSLLSIPTFRTDPPRVDRQVWRAEAYRRTMVDWLRSGSIAGGPIPALLRAHAVELTVYLLAAVASANLIALILGAALLNYMNAWVAGLLGVAIRRSTVVLLAWNVWSVVRVAAYILLGTAAAAPLAGWAGFSADSIALRGLWLAGILGLGLDLGLKLAVSGPLGRRLAAAVRLEDLRG